MFFKVLNKYKILNNFISYLNNNLKSKINNISKASYENQVNEVFIDEGRGHSPSHLKFFLLVFSKIKRRHNIKMRPKPKSPSPSPRRPKSKEPKSIS